MSANHVIGIDVGKFSGGIISGSSLSNVKIIPYPEWNQSDQWTKFFRHWEPGSAIFIEMAAATSSMGKKDKERTAEQKLSEIVFSAKRNYSLGFQHGALMVATNAWHEKFMIYCQTWRKVVFATVKKEHKPRGGMAWKKLEMKLAKFLCPAIFSEMKDYKSDNKVFGLSAAFCIWLYGMQVEGLLNIKDEIGKRKREMVIS